MSTQVSGFGADRRGQEFLPGVGNGAGVRRAMTSGTGLRRAFAPVTAPAFQADKDMRERWAGTVVTDRKPLVTALMRTAYYHVVAWGMRPAHAERALGAFHRYVNEVVAGKGAITLCLGMMVDAVRAAETSGWAPEQTSQLLVQMQKELDKGTSSLASLAATVNRIRTGASADDVLRKTVSPSYIDLQEPSPRDALSA